MRNGDLIPDQAGMITKQQTVHALLQVGISKKVVTETTDANFDHLAAPKRMNVFRMNTINNFGAADPPGPLEHFRSTGIRDGGDNPQPNLGRYVHFERCAAFDGSPDSFSSEDISSCATLVWDHETRFDVSSLPAVLPSNDINEDKRPNGTCGSLDSGPDNCTCGSLDSGPDNCPSQLHGAIIFLHEEFGTPTGESAEMPREDM